MYCKNQNLDLEQKRYQCHKARGQSSSKKSYEQKNLGNKVTCRAYFQGKKGLLLSVKTQEVKQRCLLNEFENEISNAFAMYIAQNWSLKQEALNWGLF